MTQMNLFQIATSSQRDIRALHFHLPGSAEAQKMTDISGRTYFPLFKPNDPLGAFSRMFMGMSLWASTKCYLTWKGKATPQGRSLFQLVPQTLRTDETESGLLPETWPTPRASEYKDSGPVGSKSHIHMQKKQYLCAAVKDPDQPRGSLNPQWVEWLMGYPEGWTELKD
jgi:hypothetical protein